MGLQHFAPQKWSKNEVWLRFIFVGLYQVPEAGVRTWCSEADKNIPKTSPKGGGVNPTLGVDPFRRGGALQLKVYLNRRFVPAGSDPAPTQEIGF